jgi:hypothetical protein
MKHVNLLLVLLCAVAFVAALIYRGIDDATRRDNVNLPEPRVLTDQAKREQLMLLRDRLESAYQSITPGVEDWTVVLDSIPSTVGIKERFRLSDKDGERLVDAVWAAGVEIRLLATTSRDSNCSHPTIQSYRRAIEDHLDLARQLLGGDAATEPNVVSH